MTTERKPHKWAEVIRAWADGKPIQRRLIGAHFWEDVDENPYFDNTTIEWRVKPERVDTYHLVEYMGEGDVEMYSSENLKANLRLTFEDKKLVKAEVIG